jgi:sigma-B regulation protein RsbU (phosphoserine phosphatase)
MELKATHGTPLGAMPDMPFGSSSMDLSNHDTILLYTDGVSEAIDKDEEQYTEERLREKLSGFKDAKPETITRSIINDLNIFVGEADQFDDITMLVISWFQEDRK